MPTPLLILVIFVVILLINYLILAVVGKALLSGEDLSKFDKPLTLHADSDPQSSSLRETYAYLNEIMSQSGSMTSKKTLFKARDVIDNAGKLREFPSEFTPVKVGNMDAEWVRAKGANADKRILYLHGGAFTVGSYYSHRPITSKLAELTGCSVLVVNYRLMPENRRSASVEDSKTAYKWILDNGPDGPAPLKKLAVAGDSAGGNLTLMALNWARDEGLRQADAAVGFSPATDGLLTSPTVSANLESDVMLNPVFKPFSKLPKVLIPWIGLLMFKYKPNNPEASPIYADLSNLPPLLIQCSKTEILCGDGARYIRKAQAAGSDARLQVWNHMPHVWQLFDEMLPESGDAMNDVGKFLSDFGLNAE